MWKTFRGKQIHKFPLISFCEVLFSERRRFTDKKKGVLKNHGQSISWNQKAEPWNLEIQKRFQREF